MIPLPSSTTPFRAPRRHAHAAAIVALAAVVAAVSACDLIPFLANDPPAVQISSPTDGAAFDVGDPVVLQGAATDPEDGELTGDALVWSSSVDGELGTGGFVNRSDLSAGAHTITLTATDPDDNPASASVALTMNAIPAATIDGPVGGTVFQDGDDIAFSGSGTDAEDGPLGGMALVWRSSADGDIGTGESVNRSDLTTGSHTITLSATDSDGATGSTTVDIAVNAAPAASITGPADGAVLNEGEAATFEGAGTDAEDGSLTGGALSWTSDKDGDIGTGQSLTLSTLTVGAHAITLTVTDTDGATDAASIAVTVNSAPTPSITAPADGANYDEGVSVTFEGSGSDPEDGALTGSSLVWSSSRDGQIGTGESFSRSDLSAGGHAITLTATDSDGFGVGTTVDVLIGDCTFAEPDSDGDRLPDCAETNTGTFVDSLNTGTDPNDPDTDGDGISDGDEVLGTTDGLDLPALGTSPVRIDILLEYDWFDDTNECGAHSHRPTAGQIAMVTTAFDDAPVANPDGSTGINIINDYGQGGAFTGGNFIDDDDGMLTGGVSDTEFGDYKAANFAANRHGYFHYVILPHRYGNAENNSSGQAEVNGDDLIVSLQCFVTTDYAVAHTIVHELGHNLSLRHGGNVTTNYKPNYNSVMNYKYQFPGADSDCADGGDGVLDLSRGELPDLDENDLDEPDGICGAAEGVGWDWNGDGDATDTGISADINVDSGGSGDGAFGVLQDYDDWANLYFLGINDADGAGGALAVEVVSCTNSPAPRAR